jgi:oxygen-independent coproporphyrinogen-3 oxidase
MQHDKNHLSRPPGSRQVDPSFPIFALMLRNDFATLVKKYNVPVPRYTSYPTVPNWQENLDRRQWQSLVRSTLGMVNGQEGISLYVHLPFCESLCTYCGCNKKITTNHSVENEYLKSLEKEFESYLELFGEKPVIRELHFGGGTPTFFSPVNLASLVTFIRDRSLIHQEAECSIEGHPNNTIYEHLSVLAGLGFRRISLGVQDNDPEVQRLINRIQPFANVARVTEEARKLGFTSINFDLIYGLPGQTVQSIRKTFQEVLELRPDRIAFYSYAHVPWTSRGQRLFDVNDLPADTEKILLYINGREMLLEGGYADIGMDHFSLPGDDLFLAWREGRLHRNFMGYTTQKTSFLLGLGMSSISDIGVAFAQNQKSLSQYYAGINAGDLPVFRGYFLTAEDRRFRKYILDLSCGRSANLLPEDLAVLEEFCYPHLRQLEADGLVEWEHERISVKGTGRYFIRNICSAFDLYLHRKNKIAGPPVFSSAI